MGTFFGRELPSNHRLIFNTIVAWIDEDGETRELKRKTDLIRKTITLNFLAHFLEILCRHRTTNAVKIDQNCNAIAYLINLYDRRFIKHIATIATSISSKIPIKRALNPKNWKKKKEIYHEYPFRWGAWLWTFYQQFWYLKLMYPTHLRRKEKRKIKTLLCDNVNISFGYEL